MKLVTIHLPGIVFLLISSFISIAATSDADYSSPRKEVIELRYNNLDLGNVSLNAFQLAIEGHSYYKHQGVITNNVVVLIDFDLPSTQERLFVVDLSTNTILHRSLVAHGMNSGENYSTRFSNRDGSHQSSLGFFKTNEKYTGKHGLSLRLDGLERGVNNNARNRNIVIHAADYVSNEFIAGNERLGRSFGCPALPIKGYQEAIDYLDDQVLIFIHSSKTGYQPAFTR